MDAVNSDQIKVICSVRKYKASFFQPAFLIVNLLYNKSSIKISDQGYIKAILTLYWSYDFKFLS